MRLWLSVTFVLSVLVMLQPRQAFAEAAPEPTPEEAPVKSPGLALGLSIAGPLTGYGMIALSLLPASSNPWSVLSLILGTSSVLAGPSSGHFYSGRIGRGLAFSGGRLALAILALAAFGEGMQHDDMSEASYDKAAVRASKVEVALCGGGILALSIWESIDTYFSVKADNRVHGRNLAIAPMLVPNRAGPALAGLAVTGRY